MDHNFFVEPELVYIHWPFTHVRTEKKLVRSYGVSLCAEIERFFALTSQKCDLQALYIGGGALSRLPEAIILDMSGTLRRTFNFNGLLQGTIEVNQGFFSNAQLRAWQKLGINRLVIGIYHYMQSEPPIERIRDFFSIIALAYTICITPETIAHWKTYIKKIILWQIEQISVSFVPTVHTQLRMDFYYWLREFLLSNGMQQYELYGFEVPGHGSVYMKGYLERKRLIGFGLNAESFDGVARYRNEGSLLQYIQKARSKKSTIVWSQTLSKEDIRIEKIMLGIRTQKGVCLDVVYAGLTQKECSALDEQLSVLKKNKLIIEFDNAIKLAPAGLGYEQGILLKLVV